LSKSQIPNGWHTSGKNKPKKPPKNQEKPIGRPAEKAKSPPFPYLPLKFLKRDSKRIFAFYGENPMPKKEKVALCLMFL
jgi:hypothetical protein